MSHLITVKYLLLLLLCLVIARVYAEAFTNEGTVWNRIIHLVFFSHSSTILTFLVLLFRYKYLGGC